MAGQRGLQDVGGGIPSHVKDLARTKSAGSIGGPAFTSVAQGFDRDPGIDIVTLIALDVAAEGGIPRISSIWRVYNELAETSSRHFLNLEYLRSTYFFSLSRFGCITHFFMKPKFQL